MDLNSRLYNASSHLYQAARFLLNVDEVLRQDLLEKAQKVLDKVKVNEEEVKEIRSYKGRILNS